MIPFLTYPLALAGLLSVPILLGIYFLRKRFRDRPVSSLLLWAAFSRAAEGGKRIKRMQWPLLLFLELLVLLLLVAAAVDPRWPLNRTAKRLVVVLDNSASMLASGKSGSARDRAIKAIIREAERGRFGSVMFLLTGSPPQKMGDWMSPGLEMKRALAQWACAGPQAMLDDAIGAALAMDDGKAGVLVVTDRAPADTPTTPRLKWLAVGRDLPNVAFVNATRSQGLDADKCFFEIANYGADAVRTRLVVDMGATGRKQIPLAIEAGHVRKTTLRVLPRVREVRAALPDPDALRIDNEVRLLRGETRRLRVRVGVSDPALRQSVRRALDATGMLAASSSNPHLVFTDAPSSPTGAREAWRVRVSAPEDARAFIGPFVVDGAHPLADGVSLDGVVWGGSPDVPMPGLPVIMAGNTVLISDDSSVNETRNIHLQISPDMSTLQENPAWPAIVWNLLQWRAGEGEGLREHNIRAGMVTAVAVAPGVRKITAALPDGQSIEMPVSDGKVHIAAETPGIYTVTAGEREHAFAANFISADESDLRSCTEGRWGKLADSGTLRREYAGSAWIFLLLALGVMSLHLGVAVRKGRAA